MVSGGVHGPGKGVLKRPELQKSSTSHRGKAFLLPKQTAMTQEDINIIMVSNISFASLNLMPKVNTLSLTACLKYTFVLSHLDNIFREGLS